MTPDADIAALLDRLPTLAFGFALLLCRTGAACMLIPGLGEAEVPMLPRAGLAVALTLLLLPPLAVALPAASANVWQDLALVGAELMAGLLLGWLARLILLALPQAGQFIAVLAGQSSVLQTDPALGGQTAALARLLALAAPVLVLGSGLYALPLAALAGSYRVLPAGHVLPPGDTAQAVLSAVAAMFALAVRLAAPFVLGGIVWHMALAALARLIPNIQVFFLAAPAQLLGGLALFAVVAGTLLKLWREAATGGFAALPGL